MATKRTTVKPVEETAPEQIERRWRGPSENRVSLIGRLVADPELRQTPSGKQVASFRIATNDQFGAEFHSIVAWEKLAEIAGTVLAKGRLVHIEGRLHASTWQASDGSKRRTVEIVAGRLQALDAKAQAAVEAA